MFGVSFKDDAIRVIPRLFLEDKTILSTKLESLKMYTEAADGHPKAGISLRLRK